MQILCKYYAYKYGVTLITGINVVYSLFFSIIYGLSLVRSFTHTKTNMVPIFLSFSMAVLRLHCISEFINLSKDSIFALLVNFHWKTFSMRIKPYAE